VLKLQAADTEDLQVISSHMQDALIRRADMRYVRRKRQFAVLANRFAWELMPENIRHRTGMHFENVLAVRQVGFAKIPKDAILSLLTISFSETSTPAGLVTLTFSSGPQLQLDVEYLDVLVRDLGPQWTASQKPAHD
jgi:hypothetical protein